MYFPTSAARQLATVPGLPNLPPESVLALAASPRKSFFCSLVRNGLAVWRVRPSAVLAFLSRTPTSLREHGENVKAFWSPDGTRIVVQTTLSYLVLVTVDYKPENQVYRSRPGAHYNFLAGPGEEIPLPAISLQLEGVVRVEGYLSSVSPRKQCIYLSTRSPPAIQRIPWPTHNGSGDADNDNDLSSSSGHDSWVLADYDFPWLVDSDVCVYHISHSRTTGVETWITSDGRAYFVRMDDPSGVRMSDVGTADELSSHTTGTGGRGSHGDRNIGEDDRQSQILDWRGTCIHNFETPRWVQKQRRVDPGLQEGFQYEEPRRAMAIAVNAKFSIVAVGTYSGSVRYTNIPTDESVPLKSSILSLPEPYKKTGQVCSMEWSSDGYVLAVGWQSGWGIFSVGGRCLASGFGVDDVVNEEKFQDTYMYGVSDLFWAPGDFELIMLAQPKIAMPENQLFVIPFAKSATTGQHAPDNTRYAFLQLDDRALVYRGADQPDMSVINPESDVWQHIKIPQRYMAINWPIRYSSLSSDGRLIAVAGRRGLTHYSSTSGRWKVFADVGQEQAFSVRGGFLWFHHVLVVAVEVSRSYQIRLYSRDLELSNQNVLHRELLSSPVVILSLVDNSLLVYVADNTLLHYLIIPTTESIKLHLCGSISFAGVIATPSAVRVLSWMVPSAQKQLGDPMDDLSVATVLMMVGGQLVLLRPRKSGNQEVKYDMQIFADGMEFCWTHLRGIGALENSLWGYDGQSIRVWLNALSIDPADSSQGIKESVNISLDFYPLSVLMDKGIIIGAEHEASARMTLPFVVFRHATSSHLFLHHILRYQLESGQVKEAVVFASHYQNLVFFAHALEILLHTVLESEASLDDEVDIQDGIASQESTLPRVIEFLDHFDVSLDVVVGCARKTEVTQWRRLFNVVGNPKSLFQICLSSKRLETAASYLLVLHNLEQLDEDNSDAVQLLKDAMEAKDWQLCKEVLRFLHSIDDTGVALRNALEHANLLDTPFSNGHHPLS